MDSLFAQYKPKRGDPRGAQISIVPRAEDVEALTTIAEVEGDGRIAHLIYEGIGRVIESRMQDPEWLGSSATQLRALAEHYSQQAERHGAETTAPIPE